MFRIFKCRKKLKIDPSSRSRSYSFSEAEEESLKKDFDTTVDPREWMARYGTSIIMGDHRIFHFRDQKFEKWIHAAYNARFDEGLESLWKEFLTEDEIAIERENYENP